MATVEISQNEAAHLTNGAEGAERLERNPAYAQVLDPSEITQLSEDLRQILVRPEDDNQPLVRQLILDRYIQTRLPHELRDSYPSSLKAELERRLEMESEQPISRSYAVDTLQTTRSLPELKPRQPEETLPAAESTLTPTPSPLAEGYVRVHGNTNRLQEILAQETRREVLLQDRIVQGKEYLSQLSDHIKAVRERKKLEKAMGGPGLLARSTLRFRGYKRSLADTGRRGLEYANDKQREVHAKIGGFVIAATSMETYKEDRKKAVLAGVVGAVALVAVSAAVYKYGFSTSGHGHQEAANSAPGLPHGGHTTATETLQQPSASGASAHKAASGNQQVGAGSGSGAAGHKTGASRIGGSGVSHEFWVERGSGEINEIKQYAHNRGVNLTDHQAARIFNQLYSEHGSKIVNLHGAGSDTYMIGPGNPGLSHTGVATFYPHAESDLRQILDLS